MLPISAYQDDSSDELSDVLDELLLPASDAEDNWNLEDGDSDDEEDNDGSSSEENDDMEVTVNGIEQSGDEEMESDWRLWRMIIHAET